MEIPDTSTGPARSSPTLRSASSIVAESVGLASAPVPCASSSGTVEKGIRTPISSVEESDRTEWDIKEIEFASESTNREQLNAACDTDEQDKVMDYEQTDILKKQAVDPQKQLTELQKRDRTATLIK